MSYGAGNGDDGKHYWLTPPDVMAALREEFPFDFDACPYPRPEGFDGLTAPWGQWNHVNPPFNGPTAWVRKAIAESQQGHGSVITFPVDKWIHMLIKAGAEIRNLGDVKWLATEDGSEGKGTGRWIAAIVLPPSCEPADFADHEHTQQTIAEDGMTPVCRCGSTKRGRIWRVPTSPDTKEN